MTKSKAIIRFKDKTMMKGTVSRFSPFYKHFRFEMLNGDVVSVDMDKIKAMFFVKSFDGNRSYRYSYNDEIPGAGEKYFVKFDDGEEMVGYTTQLDYSAHGFYMTPADVQGNNTYVFASRSAIESMSFV